MPLIAEYSQLKRRPAPWWVLAISVAVLLPFALFAWSCYHWVTLRLGSQKLEFGRGRGLMTPARLLRSKPNWWVVGVDIPGTYDAYLIEWTHYPK
jgi:hypothetical protein